MTAPPRRTFINIKILLATLATLSFVSEAAVNLLGEDQTFPTVTATDSTLTPIAGTVSPLTNMMNLFGDDPYPYTSGL